MNFCGFESQSFVLSDHCVFCKWSQGGKQQLKYWTLGRAIADSLVHVGKAFLIIGNFNAHIAGGSSFPIASDLEEPFDSEINFKRLLTLSMTRRLAVLNRLPITKGIWTQMWGVHKSTIDFTLCNEGLCQLWRKWRFLTVGTTRQAVITIWCMSRSN